jgi:hypothetical protein
MSNITFDVKCIRADPQAGICEIISGGGADIDIESGTYIPTITMVETASMTSVTIGPILPFKYTRIGNIINVSGVFVHGVPPTPPSAIGEYTFTITYPLITGTFTFATGSGTWRDSTAPTAAQLPVWIGNPSISTFAEGYVFLAMLVDAAISCAFSYERL